MPVISWLQVEAVNMVKPAGLSCTSGVQWFVRFDCAYTITRKISYLVYNLLQQWKPSAQRWCVWSTWKFEACGCAMSIVSGVRILSMHG